MGPRECGLQYLWQVGLPVAVLGLKNTGSIAVAHRLSCSAACGVFLDQGWNLYVLQWQVGSLPWSYQGSTPVVLLISVRSGLKSIFHFLCCYFMLSFLCVISVLSLLLFLIKTQLLTFKIFSSFVHFLFHWFCFYLKKFFLLQKEFVTFWNLVYLGFRVLSPLWCACKKLWFGSTPGLVMLWWEQ